MECLRNISSIQPGQDFPCPLKQLALYPAEQPVSCLVHAQVNLRLWLWDGALALSILHVNVNSECIRAKYV